VCDERERKEERHRENYLKNLAIASIACITRGKGGCNFSPCSVLVTFTATVGLPPSRTPIAHTQRYTDAHTPPPTNMRYRPVHTHTHTFNVLRVSLPLHLFQIFPLSETTHTHTNTQTHTHTHTHVLGTRAQSCRFSCCSIICFLLSSSCNHFQKKKYVKDFFCYKSSVVREERAVPTRR